MMTMIDLLPVCLGVVVVLMVIHRRNKDGE
jgi:hypothetical protein